MGTSYKYFIVLTLLFCASALSTFAQSGRVPVQNHADNGLPRSKYTISVKWYTPDLLHQQGVNVYRKEAGQNDWVKLNDTPIIKGDRLPPSSYLQDDNLEAFVTLVNGASASDLQGLFLLNVIFKSFESDEYAKFLGIQYDDSSVQKGRTYQYKVMKVVGSSEQLIGVSDTVTADKFEPVDPVQGVEIAVKKRKVEINWLPEENRFYAVNIYRSTINTPTIKVNDQPVVISMSQNAQGEATYPDVMYVDDSLQENVSYTYSLVGLDFFGNETRVSQELTANVRDVTPTAAPTGLREDIQNPNVILRWQNLATEDLQGFQVYRSRRSDGPYERVNPETLSASTSNYTDEGLVDGSYYYYVSSVDEAGNEAPSEKVFAEIHDIAAPSQPQGLSIAADTGQLVLSWQMNPEPDLLGYLLFRTVSKNNPDQYVLINSEPLSATRFEESLPKNAKNKFLYKIVAVDSAYNRSVPSEVAVARLPDITPPAPPIIERISSEEENLVIAWESNIEDDLLGYRIYRAEGSDTAQYQQINVDILPARTYRYTDRDITPGIDYYYALAALDSSNNESVRSQEYPARNNGAVYDPVAFKSAKANFNKRAKEVALRWKVDNDNQLVGFAVYRQQGDEGQLSPVTGLLKTNEFSDKQVSPDTRYYYEIRAYATTGEVVKSEKLSLSISKQD